MYIQVVKKKKNCCLIRAPNNWHHTEVLWLMFVFSSALFRPVRFHIHFVKIGYFS